MDLKHLIQFGFASRAHLTGADERAQDCRWIAGKQQTSLLADLQKLANDLEKIDADGNLTPAGKTAAKRKRGTEFLAGLESEAGKRLLSVIVTKHGNARENLQKAQRPAEQNAFDHLYDLMQVQNMQQHLLSLKPELLLVELARAVEARDATTYKAITSLPGFVLRDRGIARETLAAAESEWLGKSCPTEHAAAKGADVGLQVAEADREQVAKIVRAECGIEEPRKIEVRT